MRDKARVYKVKSKVYVDYLGKTYKMNCSQIGRVIKDLQIDGISAEREREKDVR